MHSFSLCNARSWYTFIQIQSTCWFFETHATFEHWNESTVPSCWQFTCFSIAWSVNGLVIWNKWPKTALASVRCKSKQLGNNMVLECIQHYHVHDSQHFVHIHFIFNIHLFISKMTTKTVPILLVIRHCYCFYFEEKTFVRKDLDLKMDSRMFENHF